MNFLGNALLKCRPRALMVHCTRLLHNREGRSGHDDWIREVLNVRFCLEWGINGFGERANRVIYIYSACVSVGAVCSTGDEPAGSGSVGADRCPPGHRLQQVTPAPRRAPFTGRGRWSISSRIPMPCMFLGRRCPHL